MSSETPSAKLAIDQLCGNPYSVASFADAAFDHVADPQFLGDRLHLHRPSLVGKTGISSDHEQLGQLRKGGNNVLGNSVGKVLLLRVATHVFERQHGDRWLVGLCQTSRFGSPVDDRRKDSATARSANLNAADKAEATTRDCADVVLPFSVIANRLAREFYAGA